MEEMGVVVLVAVVAAPHSMPTEAMGEMGALAAAAVVAQYHYLQVMQEALQAMGDSVVAAAAAL